MSPARKSRKATSKKAKARAAPKKAAKAAKRAKPKAAKAASKPSAKPGAKPAKTHCAAMDPFGAPCQSIPRYGSKYCTIHSYLDR